MRITKLCFPKKYGYLCQYWHMELHYSTLKQKAAVYLNRLFSGNSLPLKMHTQGAPKFVLLPWYLTASGNVRSKQVNDVYQTVTWSQHLPFCNSVNLKTLYRCI